MQAAPASVPFVAHGLGAHAGVAPVRAVTRPPYGSGSDRCSFAGINLIMA